MARKDKPVKIKRYKKAMGNSARNKLIFTQVVAFVVFGAILIGAGFLVGKPLINFIGTLGQSSQGSSDSLPPSLSLGSSSYDETIGDEGNTQVIPTKNKVYYNADIAKLSTQAGIDQVVSDMKTNNATHCVITLKNQDGYVHYKSENQYASALASDVIVDLSNIIKTLGENNITPVANVYTYMDKMASTINRDMGVFYIGTDARWLDSSAALGGKAWANPASSEMQQYIIDITQEILNAGIKEFIFSGFQLPTGNSLDKRDFRASNEQLLANMRTMVTTLEGKVAAKGGSVSWQVDYTALNGGSYEHYIVLPTELFGDHLILTAKSNQIEEPQVAVDLVKGLKNTQGDYSAVLWVIDQNYTDYTKDMGSYFVN